MKIYGITTRNQQFDLWAGALSSADELVRLDAIQLEKYMGLISPNTVVLIDMVSCKESFVEAAAAHKEIVDALYVAALSNIPNIHEYLGLMPYGIKAYGHNLMTQSLFREMIEKLSEGHMWVDELIMEDLIRVALHASDQPQKLESLDMLTPREQEVAYQVAQGLSNKEIAKKLELSADTVKLHLNHVYRKLGIDNRVALALKLKV